MNVVTDPEDSQMYVSHELLPLPFRKMAPVVVRRLAKAGKLGAVVPIVFTGRSGTYYSWRAITDWMKSCEAAATREAAAQREAGQ